MAAFDDMPKLSTGRGQPIAWSKFDPDLQQDINRV